MPTDVIMPALGMSQDTGRLLAWLKQEGDSVEKGDILMEIETDKATVEVEATASGILANITAQAGDDVPVGSVIALIIGDGEAIPAKEAPVEAQVPTIEASPTDTNANNKTATPVAMRIAKEHGIDINRIPANGKRIGRADVEAYVQQQAVPVGKILASPKARRLAQEQNIDLTLIQGTGPNGAIIAENVLSYQPIMTDSTTLTTEADIQTGTMWRRMSERLTESWQTIPHFYLKRDVDTQRLSDWRKSLLSRSEIRITFTDLLVKIVALALKNHPFANGQWNGASVVFNEQINVGLAVAVDEGLLVPVIHDADKLGVMAIAERRQEIVKRAQSGKLKPMDLQGGTFTISNLGMFGTDEFSAIVNPPQAAILAVGKINERIVPVNGEAVIRPMMTLSLSCDHRAIDGTRGAQFLANLANLITDPLSGLD